MTSTAATPTIDASPTHRPALIRIADSDNVAVALRPISEGEAVRVDERTVVARQSVPAGHKIALRAVELDEQIVKYGVPIGIASSPIAEGDWVHSHNLRTSLSGLIEYRYEPVFADGARAG